MKLMGRMRRPEGGRPRETRRTAGLLAAIALVFTVLSPTVAPTVAASDAESGPTTAADLKDAIEMRAALGFASDAETVLKVIQTPGTQFDFGGPLTKEESDVMWARLSQERASQALIAYVDAHDDVFGGVWFDHPDGGVRIWVGVTADARSADLQAISDLKPAGVDLELAHADQPLALLRKAQTSISDQEAKLGISGSYVDIVENEVVIGGSSSDAEKLATALGVPVRSQAITLAPVACTSRASCTPYRAAINVDFPNELCTWGFIAKTNLVSQLNLVSAGHCATISQWAKHNGTKVSTYVNRNTYDLLGDQKADALRAPLSSSANLTAPYNLLYNSDTQKSLPLDSKEGTVFQTVGHTACYVGRVHGNTCGQVDAVGISGTVTRFDGTSKHFTNLIRMNRATSGGDSGSPVRYGYTALGVVDFADTSHSNYAVYAGIDNVEYALDVKICITSSCGV